MECLFVFSGDYLLIAQQECQSIVKASAWEFFDRLGVASCGSLPSFASLALSKSAHEVLFRCDKNNIISVAHKSICSSVSGSLRIDVHKTNASDSTAQLRSDVLSLFDEPRVDLAQADNSLHIFCVPHTCEVFVTRLLWTNTTDFSSRMNKNRPCPHPTSLQPKLARAMINLSCALTSIVDPFCGSGGIVLEASLMGFRVRGIDIDESMIARAKKNLAHYHASGELLVGDALQAQGFFDAIITDLPYGRNSKAGELVGLYESFLAHATTLSSRMVIGFPGFVDHKALIAGSLWSVEKVFCIELHKNLQKIVYVLNRS